MKVSAMFSKIIELNIGFDSSKTIHTYTTYPKRHFDES